MQGEEEPLLYCYDSLQNEWSTLPPLNIRYFGLGHINDKLVILGGIKLPPSKERVNDVYTFVETTGKWKKLHSPMPTARSSPIVFSLENALIVAGGYSYKDGRKVMENVVEVFKVKESQWYRADELPASLQRVHMFGTVLNTELYLIGGLRVGATYSKVLSTSVTDLVNNAIPSHRKTDIPSTNWKILPDTPTNKSAVTSIGGLLITLGGEKKAIHMYSPSIDSWVHVGSLPELRLLTTISVLSPMEILMIGGFDGSKDVNTVYKGTLQLSS
jgi:N-acetylneuraminic acid mutarotase